MRSLNEYMHNTLIGQYSGVNPSTSSFINSYKKSKKPEAQVQVPETFNEYIKNTLIGNGNDVELSSYTNSYLKSYTRQGQYPEKEGGKRNLEFIRDINKDYMRSIFSLRKLVRPFTLKKCLFWILYLVILVLLSSHASKFLFFIRLEAFSGVYNFSEKIWLAETDLYVMFIFLGFDPLYILLAIFLGSRADSRNNITDIPDYNESVCLSGDITEEMEIKRRKEFESIALIIACHKSNDVIEGTVKSAMNHFPPQNIYVSDNGNNPVPFDNTEQLVKDIDPGIVYRWSSVGNKTLAQFLSVNAMMDRPDIKYVMIIDDDTKIPGNLTTSVEQIDDVTKAVMFGIRGVDENGVQDCLWTNWQDLEYKLGDLVKEIQCKYASVLFPHGAASLWCKDILFEVLGKHDTIFYADDVKMGMFLMRNGYRLYYNKDSVFETEVPSSIFGKSPNYYNQRVRSWDFAEHMCIFKHLGHSTFGYVRNSWVRTLNLRLFQIYVLVSIVNDWLKIPIVFSYLRKSPVFFVSTLFLNVLINMICVCIWNYWTCRGQPDIQVDFFVILTSPIYRFISNIIRVISVFYCMFIYWPNFKHSALREPGSLHKEQIEVFEAYNLGHVTREEIDLGENSV